MEEGFSPTLTGRGESGIRTLEPVAGLTVFKTVAFDRSANSPTAGPLTTLRGTRPRALGTIGARPEQRRHHCTVNVPKLATGTHPPPVGMR